MRWPFLYLATTALMTATATGLVWAQQQPTPFDMSGERPATPAPAPPLAFPDLSRPPPARPASPPLAPAPTPTPAPAEQSGPLPSGQSQNASPTPAQPPSAEPARAENYRYIIPAAGLTLEGEADRRAWSIYLTPEQATSPAKLHFAYQNAIVVAPESSFLSIFINERRITRQEIRSASEPNEIVLDVPAGFLNPGANLVEFQVTQAHRTDCTVQSTYDLWTTVDPSRTYLDFGNGNAEAPSVTEAIRSVGNDASGNTEFQLLVPALGNPGAGKSVLRLVQGLSLLSAMPNQLVSFRTDRLDTPRPGKLGIVVGTIAELQPVFQDIPAAAASAAIATLVPDPRTGEEVVLVTGPSWTAINAAIETVVSPTDRPTNIRRDVLSTQRWSAPDAPLLFGGEKLSFSQLGIDTAEFPGRRFRTGFNIAVPPDFYANAYGEATLLIDAAFTDKVRPGSSINVYVNGNIASTVPIASERGAVLRHLPIRVTLRHIKPGVNSIALETILATDEDKACLPGTTGSAEPRFALFDTSEFQMPNFARIGRSPSLESLTGTGFPYGRQTGPLMLWMDRLDANTLTAASTFLARVALVAGHPITVEPVASPSAVGNRNALFVGSISQFPQTILSQLNIAPESAASWHSAATSATETVDTQATFERWRTQVSGGLLREQLTSLQSWMDKNFNLSVGSLHLLPQAEQIFAPSSNDTFLLAQGNSLDGSGTWTAISAPASDQLRHGAEVLARQQNWQQIHGRVTAFAGKTQEIKSVAASQVNFLPTVPTSIGNYRLIAANWLSSNILIYAALLVVLSVLLGLATAAMLTRLGRGK